MPEPPDAHGPAAAAEGGPVVLPAAVRARVVALAAERLDALGPDELPASVRAFRRFTPAKRARLAAAPLAAALEADPVFRQAVARGAREALPELAAALAEGAAPPAAPPEDVAAVAYLLRPDGWVAHVAAAAADLAQRERALAGAATVDAVQRLGEQLAAVRAAARTDAERLTAELAQARAEAVALRRKVRDAGERAARAERAERSAREQLAALQGGDALPAAPSPEPDASDAGEVRRLRARLQQVEAALAAARSTAREHRHGDDVRLRVLLDAVVGAATGLRRELALPPVEERPADALAAELAVAAPGPAVASQGRADDDPALLDALLRVPAVHLLVDGYNVTKQAYGDLPLEAQRGRLLAGLGGLAARTSAELTVVFDGVDRATPVAVAGPRGVRLLFSRTGETADEVLRRLVEAEPAGRPVVVVSSDREVADAARRSGARPVASRALARLLER